VNTKDFIAKLFGRGGHKAARVLPRQTVEHDSVDEMVYGNYADDSPRFRRLAVEDAPIIPPVIDLPEAPDFTTATPEEIKAWQAKARAAKEAEASAPQYDSWSNLTRDIFYLAHHPREPEVMAPDTVDPGVAFHSKIASRVKSHEDFQISRNMTRDDATASAMFTMSLVGELKGAVEEQLLDQARQAEEFEAARDDAEAHMGALENLRDEARDLHNAGQPIPGSLVQEIRTAVAAKQQAQAQAAQLAAATPKPFDKAAADAIDQAVVKARAAAEQASNIPGFGQGLGEGEPRYESPEQALTIADMWVNNPTLRAVAELYGRFDQHMRFQRARRVVGGQDEIVDITQGAEPLRRVLPSELALLGDEDTEDWFLYKYLNGELLIWDTVGEEHAGRGPIVMVVDESGSMGGEKNVWAKAMACCLLNICRREKRDFAYVGFSSGNQVHTFLFKAKEALNAQDIVDMAAHFYGGGTTPVIGTTAAKKVMDDAHEFKKADIVMVGDGQAGFGTEDAMLRDTLLSRGVRFHGIAIGRSTYDYLNKYCGEDQVVNVSDFELTDPSDATAHLATHIT
jgi:uncharacterized protein with von Willebrand factor type A (vWA) domain